MSEVERIANGLSEAQRRDLLRLQQGDHNPGLAIFLLISKGLADYRKRWMLFGERNVTLTRKGLAVRRYLQEQSK